MEKQVTAVLNGLKGLIEGNYGSVRAFCNDKGFDRHHLYKIIRGEKSLSVGMYLRLCVALEQLNAASLTEAQLASVLPLEEYLSLPFQTICLSMVGVITTS